MYLPPERVLLICTGSQGEARAALSRIAEGRHPNIYLEEGDTVFFSSKVIPGNEEGIERLKHNLNKLGVRTVDEDEEFIHLSGHPCRDELKEMYGWLKPQVLIPVHGYPEHLQAHAEVGRACEIPKIIEVRNGDIVLIDSEDSHIVGSTPTSRRLRIEEDWRSRSRRNRNQKHQDKRASKDQGQSRRQSYVDRFRRR